MNPSQLSPNLGVHPPSPPASAFVDVNLALRLLPSGRGRRRTEARTPPTSASCLSVQSEEPFDKYLYLSSCALADFIHLSLVLGCHSSYLHFWFELRTDDKEYEEEGKQKVMMSFYEFSSHLCTEGLLMCILGMLSIAILHLLHARFSNKVTNHKVRSLTIMHIHG